MFALTDSQLRTGSVADPQTGDDKLLARMLKEIDGG